MAALVRLTVQDPQNVLDTYGAGALIRLERDTSSAMSGATEATTIPVVAGTTEYEYRDTTGVAGTHWYRSRYSKASPSVGADYSGYGPVFQAGAAAGEVITLETVKTWADIDDTIDDGWLALAVGAVNRAIVGGNGIGVDLGPSPDTTRTYDLETAEGRRATVRGDTRRIIPGGIRAFTTVEVSVDGTTWVEVTSDVRVGPAVHERAPGEPGSWIEFKPHVSGGLWSFAGYRYLRITGIAFQTFGWDAWAMDLVQAAVAALQRMSLERDRNGQFPSETNALRYLDPRLLAHYRLMYFAPVRS
jgi:hypothetical protein